MLKRHAFIRRLKKVNSPKDIINQYESCTQSSTADFTPILKSIPHKMAQILHFRGLVRWLAGGWSGNRMEQPPLVWWRWWIGENTFKTPSGSTSKLEKSILKTHRRYPSHPQQKAIPNGPAVEQKPLKKGQKPTFHQLIIKNWWKHAFSLVL